MALNARLFGAESVELESDVITSTSDTFAIVTKGLDDFTLNGYRILTTQDIAQGPPGPQGPQGPAGTPGIPTSLGAIGSTPNANGASLSGSTLILQPADNSNGGVISNTTQSFGGNKTFVNQLATNMNLNGPNCTGAGNGNLALGSLILHNYTSSGSRSNVHMGYSAGNYTNSAVNNIAIGNTVLNGVTSGSGNICLGQNAGSAITTTSNNILIANSGTVTDSNTIKIGTNGTHTSAFIAGIASISPGGTPQGVIINPSTGQLGSQALYTTATATATPTVDSGSVTAYTKNPVTIKFEKYGNVGFFKVEQFFIKSSDNLATTIIIPITIPAGFAPAAGIAQGSIPLSVNGALVPGVWSVISTSNRINLTVLSGTFSPGTTYYGVNTDFSGCYYLN